VGDTTFLDYDKIVVKREGYGLIGKGGNGLILHSALAIDPQQGQPLGLLWQKLWNREPKPQLPVGETPLQKKRRQARARKAAGENLVKLGQPSSALMSRFITWGLNKCCPSNTCLFATAVNAR